MFSVRRKTIACRGVYISLKKMYNTSLDFFLNSYFNNFIILCRIYSAFKILKIYLTFGKEYNRHAYNSMCQLKLNKIYNVS